MDERTLRKLIERLAVGRIARGDEVQARRRLLDDLYTAGIPTEAAASLGPDELAAQAGHTLLAWGRDAGPSVDLFVIPDAEVDDRMRNALDAVDGLAFETVFDCSIYQYAAAVRVLAATGLGGAAAEQLHGEWVAPVLDELAGERDLEYLPGPEELEELLGAWRSYHVGRDGFAPGSLDRRFTHAIAVRQMGGGAT